VGKYPRIVSHDEFPHTWYTTNLVGLPAPVLASTAFNERPVPLGIGGTREAHAGLFALLHTSGHAEEASDMFEHYLNLVFALQPDGAPTSLAEARRWRASYSRLLQSWGVDSNGQAGAVLKGWVESRFGMVPYFHKARLERFPSTAWVAYLEEKASSRFHNNCIYQQLDLLYEFCQWALARFKPFGQGVHVPLWRGITRCEEQIVEGDLRQGPRRLMVRLNNLVSFSTSADQAGCFGDWVLRANVPLVKLLFYPGLLHRAPLVGEGEVLAIGGDYEVEARYD
jgi:NAD+--dinitrogen-reductase ADP-D-ribosyltransferase